VGVLFYLKPDGQYILAVDDGKNKNTAMIVSLTKIYCPSELQQNRTPTVYRNVTEYNKKKHSHDSVVGVLFYLRSDGQYILVGYAVMAVFLFTIILCEVLIDSGRSFLTLSRKERSLSIRTSLSIIITKIQP
jgi:hypothetical protein